MIVDSMTFEDVYNEIARDQADLSLWWIEKREEVAQMAKRRPNFPMTNWYEWVSPRNIRYLVWSKVYGRVYHKNAVTMFVALRLTRDGFEAYVTRVAWQTFAEKRIILPHVFKRYKERAGVDKSGIELIKHFFEKNMNGKCVKNNELAGRSVRYNGETHICACFDEGVLLGQQRGNIFIERTFVTYEMATGLQKETFNFTHNNIEKDGKIFKDIRRLYGFN